MNKSRRFALSSFILATTMIFAACGGAAGIDAVLRGGATPGLVPRGFFLGAGMWVFDTGRRNAVEGLDALVPWQPPSKAWRA